MGLYSQDCSCCNHPVLAPGSATEGVNEWMNEAVAIAPSGDVVRGDYDGYGHVGGEQAIGVGNTVYHGACWETTGKPAGYAGPSPHAPDQGFFFEDGAHDLPDPREHGFVGLSEENLRKYARSRSLFPDAQVTAKDWSMAAWGDPAPHVHYHDPEREHDVVCGTHAEAVARLVADTEKAAAGPAFELDDRHPLGEDPAAEPADRLAYGPAHVRAPDGTTRSVGTTADGRFVHAVVGCDRRSVTVHDGAAAAVGEWARGVRQAFGTAVDEPGQRVADGTGLSL